MDIDCVKHKADIQSNLSISIQYHSYYEKLYPYSHQIEIISLQIGLMQHT